MNRRQYLGAAAAGGVIGVGSVVGYVTFNDQPLYPAPFDPETDQTELSGSGEGTTESFDIANQGPTIVRIDSDNSGEGFQTIFKSATGDYTRPVTDDPKSGPYEGVKIVDTPEEGSYEIEIVGTTDSWEITVYDLPAYERSDDITLQPPITRENGLDKVIGPIDFGSEEGLNISDQGDNETTTNTTDQTQPGRRTEFSLRPSESDETPLEDISYALSIYDNTGEFIDTPIYTGGSRTRQNLGPSEEEDQTKPVVIPIANIGYIQVSSNIFWSLSVENKQSTDKNTS
jgi:hypothetical protein